MNVTVQILNFCRDCCHFLVHYHHVKISGIACNHWQEVHHVVCACAFLVRMHETNKMGTHSKETAE